MEAKRIQGLRGLPAWSSILSDPAQEPCPGFLLHPEAREVTVLVLRHLLPSVLLPSWDRDTPAATLLRFTTPRVPSLPGTLPAKSQGREETAPCPGTLGNCLRIGLCVSAYPTCLAFIRGPFNPRRTMGSLCPLQPPRIFPTCLSRVSLRMNRQKQKDSPKRRVRRQLNRGSRGGEQTQHPTQGSTRVVAFA